MTARERSLLDYWEEGYALLESELAILVAALLREVNELQDTLRERNERE